MAGARLPLAVTMGDPAGVGPIITWEAWRSRKPGQRPFYVIASEEVMVRGTLPAGVAPGPSERTWLRPIAAPSEVEAAFDVALPVLVIPCPAPQPGKPDIATAPAIQKSIELAVGHVRGGLAAGVVTNPIAKALMYEAGFRHPGHTEFLAELAGPPAPRPVMMLVAGGLRVALVTIHKPLAAIPGLLTQDLVMETARIVDRDLKASFGLKRPRIGLCGLNPHAGENGTIGREEVEVINPAAAKLRAEGIDISDARPGDTIFHEHRGGRFDAVIAMYHDQGLIPVKTLDMWGGVNVTLGLPFIRTSPDHGTAYDAAAARLAKADSLITALELADRMAVARASA